MGTVFGAVRQRALWLVILSAVVAGTAYAILSIMAPRYQSEAELAIVAQGTSSAFADPRSVSSGPDFITTRMDKEAINTHVRAMQSPDVLEQVGNDLKLKDRPEFNSALGPIDTFDSLLRLVGIGGPRGGESERDRVLSALRARLEVYSAKESRFIGVRVTSIDAELAANIANAISEKYRAALAEQGVVEVDDLQTVLQAKIAKLTTEVAAADTEIDRYRGQIDGFRGGAQNTGLNEQQMSELTAELTRAKAARGEAEARANSAREMMKAGSADALADVQKSPLIQNLVQQRVRIERQISELSTTLLPGHPRMRQLNADLAGLKLQLNSEIAKIVDSLAKEAQVAKDREASIKQSLDDIKARVVTNAPEEAQLRQLEASAKAKRTELDNLQAQLESNRKRLDARAQPVEAQTISKAQPASVPVFPKKLQFSSLLAIASLMLGVAWTLMASVFHAARGGVATPHPLRASPAPRARTEPVLPRRPEPLLRELPDEEFISEPSDEPIFEPTPSMAAPVLAEPELSILREPPTSGQQVAPEPSASATPTASVPAHMTDVTALVTRLSAQRPEHGGHRTLITGETDAVDPSDAAVDLVEAIAADGLQAILVNWSPSGEMAAGCKASGPPHGLNDLLAGYASFDDVIERLVGTAAHVIVSGKATEISPSILDADLLNLILDALDEAYDHIVVVGQQDEARLLFETIEGRFDAGILVSKPGVEEPSSDEKPGTFLGFEVAEIDIIRWDRPVKAQAVEEASAPPPVADRIARATKRAALARSA